MPQTLRAPAHSELIIKKSRFIGCVQPMADRASAQAVVDALKGQLANFKIPKRCFVVQELPRNTMGKVQKNLLRDEHKQLFA